MYTQAVHQLMGARLGGRVDIIVDNAGYELVSDMLLGYILLKTGMDFFIIYKQSISLYFMYYTFP